MCYCYWSSTLCKANSLCILHTCFILPGSGLSSLPPSKCCATVLRLDIRCLLWSTVPAISSPAHVVRDFSGARLPSGERPFPTCKPQPIWLKFFLLNHTIEYPLIITHTNWSTAIRKFMVIDLGERCCLSLKCHKNTLARWFSLVSSKQKHKATFWRDAFLCYCPSNLLWMQRIVLHDWQTRLDATCNGWKQLDSTIRWHEPRRHHHNFQNVIGIGTRVLTQISKETSRISAINLL